MALTNFHRAASKMLKTNPRRMLEKSQNPNTPPVRFMLRDCPLALGVSLGEESWGLLELHTIRSPQTPLLRSFPMLARRVIIYIPRHRLLWAAI
jgi:hypothetical protein